MKINIVKVDDIAQSDAINDYVMKKLTKLGRKLIDPSDESARCDVELEKTTNHQRTGDIYQAKFILHISGKDMFASETAEDMYAAIDKAREELERQLRSHRSKKETIFRQSARRFKEVIRNFRRR